MDNAVNSVGLICSEPNSTLNDLGSCCTFQVDLKLKVCRGSSIRKILVREAKSYFATEVILGTAQNHLTIRSSVSVAKYCAKKLPKDCSILAVDNGKVVFQREASPMTNGRAKGNDCLRNYFEIRIFDTCKVVL